MATGNAGAADKIREDIDRAGPHHPRVAGGDGQPERPRPPTGRSRAEGADRAGLVAHPEVRPWWRSPPAGGRRQVDGGGHLAVTLGQLGYKVGLLDSDIYGPSVPMMFGISEKPRLNGNRIIPFEKYGIKVMSLGFILETDTPVIWRGPMVMRAIEQMLGDVEWGALDYMILDLPPGTGDAQLTVTQKVPLTGAVIVTTPQDVALIDARKGLAMFRRSTCRVIGIIGTCPRSSARTASRRPTSSRRTAAEDADLLGTAFLGAIPLDPQIVLGGDAACRSPSPIPADPMATRSGASPSRRRRVPGRTR